MLVNVIMLMLLNISSMNSTCMDPLMKDNINQSEPLDYAINNNQCSIAVYICQHCISSDEMLIPSRIKTTINLVKYILLWACTMSWTGSNEDPI
jgi:hypothetical protein